MSYRIHRYKIVSMRPGSNAIISMSKVSGTLLSALALTSLLLLPSFAQKQSTKRPPTLDPTYGLSVPKAIRYKAVSAPDAQWIWADRTADGQTIALRGSFSLAQAPRQAAVYVTADDYFTLYVNGKQVDQSLPDPKDTFLWKHVHNLDISSLLQKGSNVIALRATNAAGSAGAIARVEVDGKSVLLTGSQWKAQDSVTLPANWKATDYDDSKWPAAHVVGGLTADPWASAGGLEGWPGYDTGVEFLAHMTLAPTALLDPQNGGGKIQFASQSSDTFTVTPSGSNGAVPPSIVVDFGKEIAGRVRVEARIEGNTGGKTEGTGGMGYAVFVGTGESKEEAVKAPWNGAHRLELRNEQAAFTPYSAFRYAKLTFPSVPKGLTTGTRLIINVTLDHKYYPVEYKGSFDCSDDLLTRIWYTGAYTSHLCMQEDIWDAPKRDRARWIGDLHVSGAVINLAFADRFLMEQTMQRLRDEAQGGNLPSASPKQHVNGIPGYSCAWICTLADFHRHIGDYAYLNRQHDSLISLLDYFNDELDGRQLFANLRKAWPFVDWAPDFNKDSPQARAATHLFLVKAAREAVFLLYEMGDPASAKKYASWADSLSEAAQRYLADPVLNTFGDRRQENAMAIYSGVATPLQTQSIYEKVLAPNSPAWDIIATPYYNNYVIYAMSQAGHTMETLSTIRAYWGGMLNEGATSWWESYDPKWDKNDFHAHLQADDSTGYFVSLAHGWSTGPTSWLTERVLGVRPTTGGFKTVDIAPELGDLAWAEGDVPTPTGILRVRADKHPYGLSVKVTIPRDVRAALTVPGKTIYVTGPKTLTLKSPDIPLPKPQ